MVIFRFSKGFQTLRPSVIWFIEKSNKFGLAMLSCIFSKHKLLALTVICFCFFASEAQYDSLKQEKKYFGHLIFSAGLAEPLGELSSQNYSRFSSGAANTGLGIQFAFHKPFSKYFGICAAFHRESFFLDEKELTKLNQTGLSPGYVAKVEVLQNWSASGIQAGLFAKVPMQSGELFFFEPRLMFGLARGKSPGYVVEIDSVVPQPEPFFSVTQMSARSSNISATFLFGLGVNYHIKSGWCFAIHFDYVSLLAETEYDDIQVSSSTGQSRTVTWDMEMRYYTVRLGIGRLLSY